MKYKKLTKVPKEGDFIMYDACDGCGSSIARFVSAIDKSLSIVDLLFYDEDKEMTLSERYTVENQHLFDYPA